jgi:hypothetical protein
MKKVKFLRLENSKGIGPFNVSDRKEAKLRECLKCNRFITTMGLMPTPAGDIGIAPVWNNIRAKRNVSTRFGATTYTFNRIFHGAFISHGIDPDFFTFAQQIIDHLRECDYSFIEYEASPYAVSDDQILYNPRTKKLLNRFYKATEFLSATNPDD